MKVRLEVDAADEQMKKEELFDIIDGVLQGLQEPLWGDLSLESVESIEHDGDELIVQCTISIDGAGIVQRVRNRIEEEVGTPICQIERTPAMKGTKLTWEFEI